MRRAMILEKIGLPLKLVEMPIPRPASGEVLIRVHACGVCRTDLHIIDGELPHPKLPLILGHQIVGTVVSAGEGVNPGLIGTRVGVPWLGRTCGSCQYCLTSRENLCDNATYTGYSKDGGFSDYCVANANFIFPIPSQYSDLQAAPLLCAGLIGYRSLRMTEKAAKVGFYGFGASAHLLIQVARHQGQEVFAFTRKGDVATQTIAKNMGAVWVGDSDTLSPTPLDAAIIFAPVGSLVPQALKAVSKGGVVICAGIHMSDIPSFPYSLLWEERILRSVANLTRQDGEEFLALAPKIPIHTEVTEYPLEQLNQAFADLKSGKTKGTGVINLKDK